MTTVSPCYAQADSQIAQRLSQYLAQNSEIRVFLEEGAIETGQTLTDKARDARTADVVVVLLSPNSVPLKWLRHDWEEAFITGPKAENVRIAFLLCAECQFPAVLRGHAFFDNRRALKRWIQTGEIQRTAIPASLETLAVQIADKPGLATSALADQFVEHCSSDFAEVFWLRCGDRSLAQLSGELGWRMKLSLDGETAVNIQTIRRVCEQRRFLIVLEDCRTPQARELICGGQTSTLLTEASLHVYEPTELEQLQIDFAQCLNHDWQLACKLARRAVAIARSQSRLAEVFEIMQTLSKAASERGDKRIREEGIREQIWILEHWNRLDEAQSLRAEIKPARSEQMTLGF